MLAMDESVLDVDQVENLIKFCPTKEEMELLKVNFKLLELKADGRNKLDYGHFFIVSQNANYSVAT